MREITSHYSSSPRKKKTELGLKCWNVERPDVIDQSSCFYYVKKGRTIKKGIMKKGTPSLVANSQSNFSKRT